MTTQEKVIEQLKIAQAALLKAMEIAEADGYPEDSCGVEDLAMAEAQIQDAMETFNDSF